MTVEATLPPGRLTEGVRPAKGPSQGDSYGHSYCPKCNKVIYNLDKYGPKTPSQHNRTFCTCEGKMTGIVMRKRKIYGIEDINSKEFLRP